MKADLTRSSFVESKHYRSVRMQQGRVQLDADWNEQQDILHHRIETETLDVLGDVAAPADGTNFKLTGKGATVAIGQGDIYVKGVLCENKDDIDIDGQDDVPANACILVNGKAQGLPAPDGTYLGFIHVWQRHVTALEDPAIREIALDGPDTATRLKTLWQVHLLRLGDVVPNFDCTSTNGDWIALTQEPAGKLAARAQPTPGQTNPCKLSPTAGYRRLDNLLYRVEIHLMPGKDPVFKWSHDNGSIAAAWLGASAGSQPGQVDLQVSSLGRDATLTIDSGHWVELFDDTTELLGLPGTLVQVLKAEGSTVTVDAATATVSPIDYSKFPNNPRVRRWDGWQSIKDASAQSTDNGWIELEDGVQIVFAPVAGPFRHGDYWMFPARTATSIAQANVEWPVDANQVPIRRAPHGVAHAYERLGLLTCLNGQWSDLSDCRPLFPTLTELTNLYYVGGDGQEVAPNPVNLQPVQLPSALEVAVFNGEFPVAKAKVAFVVNPDLPNENTHFVETNDFGLASFVWHLLPDVLDQKVTAKLLQAGAVVQGKYNQIHFSARLSRALEVAYDPAKCVDLKAKGVNNVQDAIDVLCARPQAGGCCVTVGKTGQFKRLDEAIAELITRGERDICICLLPGEHRLGAGIELQQPGLKLEVHGAGHGSRLVLRGEKFDFADLDAVTLSDFDIVSSTEKANINIAHCVDVELRRLQLAGLTQKGASLLHLEDASKIDLIGSEIRAYTLEGVARARDLLTSLPFLKPFQASFSVEEGELFAPLTDKVVGPLANLNAQERKDAILQIEKLLRDGAPNLTTAEARAALAALRAEFDKPDARSLSRTLDRLRDAMLSQTPGYAVCIADANALTLLADNQIRGRLSYYGESSQDMQLDPAFYKRMHDELLRNHTISLSMAQGDLRLRNNRLRDVRFGDEMFKRIVSAVDHRQGSIDGCLLSLVADANTLTGPASELLAFDLALSQNVLQPFDDVGVAIAMQAKYIGNFAHNDFRLFNVGNDPESFGNGRLNIVT